MTPFLFDYLPFKLNLWLAARLLPVAAKRAELSRLLAAATPPSGRHPYAGQSTDAIVAAVKTTCAHPWRMRGRRCLREGLLTFRFLRAADIPATLHFGVDRRSMNAAKIRAHCWVSVGDEIVINPPEPDMICIYSYDGRPDAAPVVKLSAEAVSNA